MLDLALISSPDFHKTAIHLAFIIFFRNHLTSCSDPVSCSVSHILPTMAPPKTSFRWTADAERVMLLAALGKTDFERTSPTCAQVAKILGEGVTASAVRYECPCSSCYTSSQVFSLLHPPYQTSDHESFACYKFPPLLNSLPVKNIPGIDLPDTVRSSGTRNFSSR
jgi:hypothetical protein